MLLLVGMQRFEKTLVRMRFLVEDKDLVFRLKNFEQHK